MKSLRPLLAILTCLILAGCRTPAAGTAVPAPADSPAPSPSATASPVPTAVTPEPAVTAAPAGDLWLLSMYEEGHTRLFAFSSAGFTRITAGEWDDRAPAASPNGDRIAYASRANGYWDLFLLDPASGAQTRLTDTLAHDSAPAWSPDAQWLAYETDIENNLEIAILSVSNPGQPPLRLTSDPGIDSSPAWSPGGRQIAFVSTRAGQSDVWLADLNFNSFANLSASAGAIESHPAWSADGRYLAWGSASLENGLSGIYVWDSTQPAAPARWVGAGDWPAWDPRGTRIAARLSSANQEYLTAYGLDGALALAPVRLPGALRGLAWSSAPLPAQAAAALTPAPLWSPSVAGQSETGRWMLADLNAVQAPYPQLHDLADESFNALRARLIAELGWDALANLQYAYVPISTPLDPGLGDDWLYTGRAFLLNPLLITAGWMAVLREDIGPQTYWRVYLRASAQDGSQGEPLPGLPWDLAARYSQDPRSYEQGGAFGTAPGYWVDLTALALQYGWERLPALPNWRTYYAGARLAEFALTGGLDWRTAMLELYPPDVLITPTAVVPPTATPTRTPWGFRPTATPSPRPTLRP